LHQRGIRRVDGLLQLFELGFRVQCRAQSGVDVPEQLCVLSEPALLGSFNTLLGFCDEAAGLALDIPGARLRQPCGTDGSLDVVSLK